ncbi:MAG: polymer-forming cytoskeletal protein [Rhodothermales bacterium]
MALFRNDNSDPTMSKQRSGAPVPPGQVNIIGHGTVIEGGLRAKSDVRISGKVIGNVNVEGKTVVTPEGVVEGEVRSSHADIAGRIEGELFVQERLVLKDSAVVEGNIHTAKLVIEDGAKFSGTCEMGGQSKPGPGKPTPSAADEASEGRRADRPAAPPKS